MSYVPLHVHSHYSLLDGLPSPRKIVERAKEIGAPAIAITDHGNIAAMVDHHKACKKAGIKPISGIELYICQNDPSIKTKENDKRNHLIVLAKNDDGIKELMALVSATNRPDWFYRKPRIDLENLAQYAAAGNLLCLSACIAGELPMSLFTDFREACLVGCQTENIAKVKELLVPNWQDVAAQIIEKHQKIFGKENYYLELQEEGMTIQKVVLECLRQMAKDLDVQSVATLDSHYTHKKDAEDHRILLYSQMHTTAEEQDRLKKSGGDIMAFFYLDQFHIFDQKEMEEHYEPHEIEASLEIADKIKVSNLAKKPRLPKFVNEDMGKDSLGSDEYLKQLCIEGAKVKLRDKSDSEKKQYWERLQRELTVIEEAGLADYFLIMQDACRFVDENHGPRGKGRGSGAGSLVNYLVGITGIDPIEYGLYFERFYNASRNIPPHFDVGHTDFMTWYMENIQNISNRDMDEERKSLAITCAKMKRIKNLDLLKEEARWIDEHNPKMWLYFNDAKTSEENPSNSHIAYAIGLTNELDESKSTTRHAGRVSLPDIDVDFGVAFRSSIMEYLKERWGEDYVAQMITFNRLQGKAALKEVFRAQPETVKHLMKVKAQKEGKDPNEASMSPFDLCNEITKHIPDEAAIADELQQLRKENDDPDYGILRWTIDNIEQVAEAYEWYKPLFDQAMRIEGTNKAQSRHAAGVVIADVPINQIAPLSYDAKDKSRVVGFEMSNAEYVGAVKFDFLGVAALDKLWFGQNLINDVGDETVLDEDFKEEGDG